MRWLCIMPREKCGGLAQLGEHYVRNVGVGGSTPLPSTTLVDNFNACQ